jgi:hypothetical protein
MSRVAGHGCLRHAGPHKATGGRGPQGRPGPLLVLLPGLPHERQGLHGSLMGAARGVLAERTAQGTRSAMQVEGSHRGAVLQQTALRRQRTAREGNARPGTKQRRPPGLQGVGRSGSGSGGTDDKAAQKAEVDAQVTLVAERAVPAAWTSAPGAAEAARAAKAARGEATQAVQAAGAAQEAALAAQAALEAARAAQGAKTAQAAAQAAQAAKAA